MHPVNFNFSIEQLSQLNDDDARALVETLDEKVPGLKAEASELLEQQKKVDKKIQDIEAVKNFLISRNSPSSLPPDVANLRMINEKKISLAKALPPPLSVVNELKKRAKKNNMSSINLDSIKIASQAVEWVINTQMRCLGLTLSHADLTGIDDFTDDHIIKLLDHCPAIETLSLPIGKFGLNVAEWISKLQELSALQFFNCPKVSFIEAISSAPKLSTLKIESVVNLKKAEAISKIQGITTLKLTQVRLRSQELDCIWRMSQLRELDIGKCWVDVAAAQKILAMPELRKFEIMNEDIDQEAKQLLLQAKHLVLN